MFDCKDYVLNIRVNETTEQLRFVTEEEAISEAQTRIDKLTKDSPEATYQFVVFEDDSDECDEFGRNRYTGGYGRSMVSLFHEESC